MSYDSGMAVSAERQPDFGAIFSSLRQEVSRAIEISGGTSYLANNLKPMLQDKENECLTQKDESGVIGMLWAEIYKLRDANTKGEKTMAHLKEIIGS